MICLLGPTGIGKTNIAIELVQRLPLDIISVDSVMVYRGMDIGAAKPTLAEQKIAPHRLIDILDPTENYSAGQFCLDAKHEIDQIESCARIPLLVGGSMLYFRALQYGLSELPPANPEWREHFMTAVAQQGWAFQYEKLIKLDPTSANRIQPKDHQRIQRALEICELTGQPMSEVFTQSRAQPLTRLFLNIGLLPTDRGWLSERIEQRFKTMLKNGLIEEVTSLHARSDLHPHLPSMRAVGYQQLWHYLDGKIDFSTMQSQSIAASRQLAKRQLTWLRHWKNLVLIPVEKNHSIKKTLDLVLDEIKRMGYT